MPGTLYLVATPIGNLDDMTFRAVQVLRNVALIAAEDTRRTAKLLRHFSIPTPTTSFHAHNERQKASLLLRRLRQGDDIAVVSDAGTPGISDPGVGLVREAIQAEIDVRSIPGPTAFVSALTVSGLPTDRFLFAGFIPARSSDRRRWLSSLATCRATLIAFETPHRIRATLEDMLSIFGDRPIMAARELTKLHETVVRGPISAVMAGDLLAKGEITLVISGSNPATSQPVVSIDPSEIVTSFWHITKTGVSSRRSAVREVAERYGLSVRQVYRMIEQEKERDADERN